LNSTNSCIIASSCDSGKIGTIKFLSKLKILKTTFYLLKEFWMLIIIMEEILAMYLVPIIKVILL